MRLTKLKIENYKIIHDSTEIDLARVTCLVGKNESGKSALIEALEKIKPVDKADATFEPIYDYPRVSYAAYKDTHENNPANVVTLSAILDERDFAELEKKFHVVPVRSNTLTIKKGYNNHVGLSIDWSERDYLDRLLKHFALNAAETKQAIADDVAGVISKLEALAERSEKQSQILDILKGFVAKKKFGVALADALIDRIPTFVLFSEYRQLEGRISLSRFKEKVAGKHGGLSKADKVFEALLGLVNTSVEDLEALTEYEKVTAELEAISNTLTDEMFEYWTTNQHLEVLFKFEVGRAGDPAPFNQGMIFDIRIKNNKHRVTVPFDERSTGFRWFFSFLVWFSQVRRTYGENLVILLDEPGLNLHGKAQNDLLRYIKEKLEPHHQVIYTTHSPFMIDPENLLRVRMVEDREDGRKVLGTKVTSDIFAVEKDTLLPIQTALGYDISQALFIGPYCLVVEGPADLLYLRWFASELRARKRVFLDPAWVISPIGGVTKIGSYVALIYPRTKLIAVLTDYESGGKSEIERLRKSDLLKKGHVITADSYVGQREADLEDMIGRDLMVALTNQAYALTGSSALPQAKSASAPERVAKEIDQHFKLVAKDSPMFDHMTPATFLAENGQRIKSTLPGLDEALDRFEKLFSELNSLLPKG